MARPLWDKARAFQPTCDVRQPIVVTRVGGPVSEYVREMGVCVACALEKGCACVCMCAVSVGDKVA